MYTGSVGKVLPLIYCVGKETHVGEPLQGLNASWMAAEAVNQIELSDNYIDRKGDEATPPPTCLKLADLKGEYSVQTPSHAYVLYNILTLTSSPDELLEKLQHTLISCSNALFERIALKHTGGEEINRRLRPKVFTFEELFEKGLNRFGVSLEKELERALNNDEDSRELSVRAAAVLSNFFLF